MKTVVASASRLSNTVLRYRRLVATFSNWPLHLAAKWGCLGRKAVVMKTRSGWELEVPWQLRHAFKEVFLYCDYLQPDILAQLPQRPVVIDVGGNVGFFSLFALHLRPQARCFTFEPVEGNFAQLKNNHHRNSRADWRLFNAAVAGTDGKVQICTPSGGTFVTDAFIQNLHEGIARNSEAGETVEACALETIFSREAIEHCDWLKLDCEGAEYGILFRAPASLFERISAITLETHRVDEQGHNTNALANHLERLGYKVWQAGDMLYALRTA